jgi:phosphoribosylformylglycinamidine synthase
MEATLEALEKIDIQGLKDLGGGGLTCCISEMAAKGGNGALMELTKVPLREEGMTPYEIMLSESQERMVFVVNQQEVEGLLNIFQKHELPYSVIGLVTDNGQMVVTQEGEVVADLPCELLADPPLVERKAREPIQQDKYVELEDKPADESLLKILSSPNIASKKWVYRQYDHEVQIRTVVKPGDDAAVLRVDQEKGFTLTTDCNNIHCYLDPYHGGAGAVAEAIRNVVAMGSEPLCMVDCLNFGNPEKPEVFWQFRECVQGMSDVARRFNLPVISGNVSFYNETEGITVNPSPVVSVAGALDLKDIRTTPFKNEGDLIILIGHTHPELDGSEYHKTMHGVMQGKAPQVDIEAEYQSAQALLELVKNDDEGNITALHDLSSGGLAIALAEMTLEENHGAVVDLSKVPRDVSLTPIQVLFSESHARYLLTVREDSVHEITSALTSKGVSAESIGRVEGNSLVIKQAGINIMVEELKNAHQGPIEKFMA